MQIEVDQRAGSVFDRREALVEGARRKHALEHRLRHWLAGAVVDREAAQQLRLLKPVLEELRGELDEIGRDVRSGDGAVGHVREEPMQAVAELVEERPRVLEAEQGRRTIAALGEVHHVDDDRTDVAGELLLAAIDCSSRRRSVSRCGAK